MPNKLPVIQELLLKKCFFSKFSWNFLNKQIKFNIIFNLYKRVAMNKYCLYFFLFYSLHVLPMKKVYNFDNHPGGDSEKLPVYEFNDRKPLLRADQYEKLAILSMEKYKTPKIYSSFLNQSTKKNETAVLEKLTDQLESLEIIKAKKKNALLSSIRQHKKYTNVELQPLIMTHSSTYSDIIAYNKHLYESILSLNKQFPLNQFQNQVCSKIHKTNEDITTATHEIEQLINNYQAIHLIGKQAELLNIYKQNNEEAKKTLQSIDMTHDYFCNYKLKYLETLNPIPIALPTTKNFQAIPILAISLFHEYLHSLKDFKQIIDQKNLNIFNQLKLIREKFDRLKRLKALAKEIQSTFKWAYVKDQYRQVSKKFKKLKIQARNEIDNAFSIHDDNKLQAPSQLYQFKGPINFICSRINKEEHVRENPYSIIIEGDPGRRIELANGSIYINAISFNGFLLQHNIPLIQHYDLLLPINFSSAEGHYSKLWSIAHTAKNLRNLFFRDPIGHTFIKISNRYCLLENILFYYSKINKSVT